MNIKTGYDKSLIGPALTRMSTVKDSAQEYSIRDVVDISGHQSPQEIKPTPCKRKTREEKLNELASQSLATTADVIDPLLLGGFCSLKTSFHNGSKKINLTSGKVTRKQVIKDFAGKSFRSAFDFACSSINSLASAALSIIRDKGNEDNRQINREVNKINKGSVFETLYLGKSIRRAIPGALRELIKPPLAIGARLKTVEKSNSPEVSLGRASAISPYQKIDEKFAEGIRESGWHGKTILAGEEDIEDQSILAWIEKGEKGDTLRFSCTLTREGHEKISNWLKSTEDIEKSTGWKEQNISTIEKGEIRTTDESFTLPVGKMYAKELAPGMTFVYNPIEENYSPTARDHRITPYSLQGNLSIEIEDAKCTPEEIHTVLSNMKKMGISSKMSTPMDLEYLYLNKMAWALNTDTDNLKSSTKVNVPLNKKIGLHKEHLSKHLGIEDVSKVSGYDWKPRFEKAIDFNSRGGELKEAGWAFWNRFDTDILLENDLKDYCLTHNIYSSVGELGDSISSIIRSTASLVCTEQRFSRLGINKAGVSSAKDRYKGGARYMFTHLEKDPRKGVLVFSKDLLKRADHMAFHMGVFGNVSNDGCSRKTTLDSYNRTPLYEVMFKHSISFLDYLEQINVNNEKERADILKAFQETGVARIRGKKVEDIVLIR